MKVKDNDHGGSWVQGLQSPIPSKDRMIKPFSNGAPSTLEYNKPYGSSHGKNRMDPMVEI